LIINAPVKNNFKYFLESIKEGLSSLNLHFNYKNEETKLLKIYETANTTEVSRLQFQKMLDIAQSHGGKVISTEYIQNSYLYEWQCKDESHPIWRASFSSVVSKKTWCKICGNKKSGLKRSKKAEPSNYLGHIIRK
jgi:hypothetical protein